MELGDKVQDRITGFAGTATARTDYMTGCVRWLVEGKAKDGNESPVECWFDEDRLDPASEAKAGGPGATPPSRDPRS